VAAWVPDFAVADGVLGAVVELVDELHEVRSLGKFLCFFPFALQTHSYSGSESLDSQSVRLSTTT
jgi:hypothetical protein